MLNKLKVLVAESDGKLLEDAVRSINDSNFELVMCVDNGRDCVEAIKRGGIDIALISVALPYVDGYGVMEEIKNIPNRPKVFFMSNLRNDLCINKSLEMGVEYYFIKPIDYNYVKQTMLRIVNGLSSSMSRVSSYATSYQTVQKNIDMLQMQRFAPHKPSIEEEIAKIFISLGIPAHIKGYQFLREAVKSVVAKPELINSITKQLYPTVAENFNTTSSKVERAIRHAIEVAWARGKLENLNKLFGFKIYNSNEKPTNGEFIALLADKLLVEYSI